MTFAHERVPSAELGLTGAQTAHHDAHAASSDSPRPNCEGGTFLAALDDVEVMVISCGDGDGAVPVGGLDHLVHLEPHDCHYLAPGVALHDLGGAEGVERIESPSVKKALWHTSWGRGTGGRLFHQTCGAE